ncbi:MAG: GNAT family N-acetyltransferase, partial [Proteobacteria bacterium]|nr:GNAT family N-acetyltransferase [Pseudomonadota bacterium]
MDLSALGADRGWLLAALSARAPGLAWIAEAGNGFCLGRDGRSAWQIGPVVAEDEVTAIALIRAALAQKAMGEGSGPMTLDVPDHHTGLVDWLAKAGFQAERPYTRMLLDHDRPLDDPGRVFAITGPELG